MSYHTQTRRNCTINKHNKPHPTRTQPLEPSSHCVLDARNHYPQIKHHTPPPKLERQQAPTPGNLRGHRPTTSGFPTGRRDSGPVASKPNSVSDDPPTTSSNPDRSCDVCRVHQTRHPLQARPIQRIAQVTEPPQMWAGLGLVVLLRKEVIQPHLPVRLPCYDFVPIADPTFDGSLPQGVRPPASGVTDFHDVTGGVYKARERIHRSVADLRLLATPTSRGRVADPDPN